MSLSTAEIDALAASVLDVEGVLLRDRKVFTRTRLIAEVAPMLYGANPTQLDRVIDRILASRAVVPLVGVMGAHEQAYATAEVLATEQTIATPSTNSRNVNGRPCRLLSSRPPSTPRKPNSVVR